MHLVDFLALVDPHPPEPDFNLPAFVACMVVVALVLWIGFRLTKKPETRTRGLILIALIILPAFVSGLGILLRFLI